MWTTWIKMEIVQIGLIACKYPARNKSVLLWHHDVRRTGPFARVYLPNPSLPISKRSSTLTWYLEHMFRHQAFWQTISFLGRMTGSMMIHSIVVPKIYTKGLSHMQYIIYTRNNEYVYRRLVCISQALYTGLLSLQPTDEKAKSFILNVKHMFAACLLHAAWLGKWRILLALKSHNHHTL